jgi:hypothetical protein
MAGWMASCVLLRPCLGASGIGADLAPLLGAFKKIQQLFLNCLSNQDTTPISPTICSVVQIVGWGTKNLRQFLETTLCQG